MITAIVLAGGRSTRMGRSKALIQIKGKEMLVWVVEGLKPLVNEIIVVAKDESAQSSYRKIVPHNVKIFTDVMELDGPLVGMYTAFLECKSEYAYAHPIDSPVINKSVIQYLFQKADGYDASIIKWDDGTVEPMHAVYNVRTGLAEAKRALDRGDTSAKVLASKLENVNYIPVDNLRKFDDKLVSLLNVNTPQELDSIASFL
ncbi:MAG TPA: molybdenum cofactor guanylyltransferase [Nitrososphaerales archaeon]|nr:molybdenum cofactor guanylyltransferase [Nitrososphaerales archaeon]